MKSRKPQVLITGMVKSGKTALFTRLKNGGTSDREEHFDDTVYRATYGIDFALKIGDIPAVLWDTSGADKDRVVVESYVGPTVPRKPDLDPVMVLTLDSTGDFKEQERYLVNKLGLREQRQPGATKYILAVTKDDAINTDPALKEQCEALRDTLLLAKDDLIFCSAKTGKNLDKLVRQCTYQITPTYRSAQDEKSEPADVKKHELGVSLAASYEESDAMASFVKKEIIEKLAAEQKTLEDKYPLPANKKSARGDSGRIQAVEAAVKELVEVEKSIRLGQLQRQEIAAAVDRPFQNYLKDFDKRKGCMGWLKKIVRIFASVLFALTVLGPRLKQEYHSSKNKFFSLSGKTYDIGEALREKAKEIPGLNLKKSQK